ncbi:GTP-binding protein [Burkholderia cepacia]|uniref:GTP-binding protein n=1 Tax=Burkholderia cepacia TaxID=292 RepID=UPI0035299B79
MVIHGVQHRSSHRNCSRHGQDWRTRIVFITRGVDAQALGDSLSVLGRRRAHTASPSCKSMG